ncbi:Os03g0756700 [Oryza sativa Japonica Group]|nr:Os03g0756700 [Oryza sativa Japonica Group]|eukprot:NP_001051318.2 Os03g0756700 [Oryza sativa Japonica Group]
MKTKNSTFVSQAQKRLAFTTKLMQYILPVLPDRLLAANAIDSCETIVYRTSRLALPDAFNPAISSVSDANNFIPTESMPQNQTSTSEKEDDKLVPEVLETFTMRAERATTFQDLATETRDLERWSILHHFIKLHKYSRLHEDDVSNIRPKPCRSTIRKHAGPDQVSVDFLNSVRCRLLN